MKTYIAVYICDTHITWHVLLLTMCKYCRISMDRCIYNTYIASHNIRIVQRSRILFWQHGKDTARVFNRTKDSIASVSSRVTPGLNMQACRLTMMKFNICNSNTNHNFFGHWLVAAGLQQLSSLLRGTDPYWPGVTCEQFCGMNHLLYHVPERIGGLPYMWLEWVSDLQPFCDLHPNIPAILWRGHQKWASCIEGIQNKLSECFNHWSTFVWSSILWLQHMYLVYKIV